MTPDGGLDPDDPDVVRRIGVAWRELRRGASMSRLRVHLHGEGEDALDLGQVDALDLLSQRPQFRMNELAEVLRVDASTATRAVQRLEKAGLARRDRDPDDARVVMVSLTAEGRHRHDEMTQWRRKAMDEILDAFSPEERPVLAEMLERLIGSVDAFVERHG